MIKLVQVKAIVRGYNKCLSVVSFHSERVQIWATCNCCQHTSRKWCYALFSSTRTHIRHTPVLSATHFRAWKTSFNSLWQGSYLSFNNKQQVSSGTCNASWVTNEFTDVKYPHPNHHKIQYKSTSRQENDQNQHAYSATHCNCTFSPSTKWLLCDVLTQPKRFHTCCACPLDTEPSELMQNVSSRLEVMKNVFL